MLVGIDRKWTPLNQPEHRVFNTLSALVERVELELPWRIPDLRRAPSLIMASDYSGDHQVKHGATYRGLSFLITDPARLHTWDSSADSIRGLMIRDDREMAFKSRRDAVRARALPPWLAVANFIPGLLATVLIDRALDGVPFNGTQEQLAAVGADSAMLKKWQPAPFERAMRVMLYGMTFVAGLARAAKSVMWISDNDEIVPDNCFQDFARMAAATAHMLCPHQPDLRFTRTSDGERGQQSREDICSIPDIAAGTLCRLNETYIREGTDRPMGKILPLPASLASDITELVRWHADDRWPLKRIVFIVRAAADRIDTVHYLPHARLDPASVVGPAAGVADAAVRQPIAMFERATIPLGNGYPVTIAHESKRWVVFDHVGDLLGDSEYRVDALNTALLVLRARAVTAGYKRPVPPRSTSETASH